MVKQILLILGIAIISESVNYTVSGGTIAVQQHIAYSSFVQGAGIVEAGPYYCSLGSSVRLQTACTKNPWLIYVPQLVQYAKERSADGTIDPVSNLQNHPVFFFSGTLDAEVVQATTKAAQTFYENFVSETSIFGLYTIPANHAWVTTIEGNPCWYFGSPFINDCGTDLSGLIFHNVISKSSVIGAYDPNNLHLFDQSDYADTWAAGISSRGYIYVPSHCKTDPTICHVHVNFHSCLQEYDRIGNVYVKSIGMVEWAEGSNIIVIFPQTVSSQHNRYACWDDWGYTGPDFALKSGLQLSAVHNMTQNYIHIINSL